LRVGQSIRLGAQDERAATLEYLPLIGREEELAQLRRQWQETRRGKGSVVLVEGEGGSGKGRLVQEFLRDLREAGTLILAGKSVQANPVPFALLREAVESHLRRLRRLPEAERVSAEAEIRAAAGEFAPLLKRLSPGLAALLKEIPDWAEAAEAQELFYDAVVDFLLALARSRDGVVLFLDDVQWADDASHQILRRLSARIHEAPLLFVGTSRNGPNSIAGLQRFVADVGNALSLRLLLNPLGEEAVAQLVAARLGGYRIDQAIVGQLRTRSNGNPFAVSEYVSAMLDAGLLRPSWGSWLVDTEGLEQLDLPTDVLQLAIRRVGELAAPSREILTTAAVIGPRFRAELLAPLHAVDIEEIHIALSEAIQAHLIERGDEGEYLFVHNRIREALLSGLELPEQRALHQRIAETLDVLGGDEEEFVYALAHHFALGLINRNPRRVFQTNFAAGTLALRNYADEEAYTFLEQSHRSATTPYGRPGGTHFPPDSQLEEALGIACVRTSRLDEATIRFQQSIIMSSDRLRSAQLHVRLADVYLAKYDPSAAWVQVERGFKELEKPAPKTAPGYVLSTVRHWMLGLSLDRLRLRYGSAKGQERERSKILVQLYEVATRVLFFDLRDELLMAQMMVRPLYTAHLIGPSRELAGTYMHYAVLMGILKREGAMETYIQKSLSLAESLGDRLILPYLLLNQVLAKHLFGHTRDSERLMRRALEEHGRWMEVGDYLKGCLDLAWNLLMRGYTREAWEWVQRATRRAEQATALQEQMPGHPIVFYTGALLAVLGRPTEAQAYLKRAREFLEKISLDQYRWGWGNFLGHQLLFFLEQGELGAPLEEVIEQHRKLGLEPHRARLHLRHFYVFQGYARLAQMMRAAGEARGPALERLREAVGELKAAANHPEIITHYLVIFGAAEGLEGRYESALERLAEAEKLALSMGSPWVLYEVARHRAHLMMERDHGMAMHQARIAHSLAVEYGWLNRVRVIRATFQVGDSTRSTIAGRSMQATGTSTDTSSLKLQRHLNALLEVSLASSSVLDPENQARAALDAVVRILAGERAFLFLWNEESESLELRAGRDARENDLTDLTGYSRTVVEQVRSSRQPLVVSGTDDGAVLGAISVVTHDLRSILAAPLMMQDQFVGVVYLDNHLAGGIFTEDDVEILQAIGNHIAIAIEIAQTIQTQSELEKLQELDQLKSRFFASVSHELRTPLNAIIGFSRLMIKGIDGPMTERQLQDVTTIHNSGKHLLNLINDILDLSKIAAGKMELVLEEMALAPLVEEAIASNWLLVENKPVELRSEVVGKFPPIVADRQRIYQVMLNLISNAAKFTEEGHILLRATLHGEMITIEVEDTGPGIPADKHDTIFQEFGQAHATHGQKGTGLGLPISRRLVEMHSGRLWVESEVGKGSTFCFTLPVRGPNPAAEAAS
ncbi:MAG: AAA family ATPase, partial [Ardenticatenales bacterium]|nr:AAA family ATPase [Ardenticatenales bacterium]